MKTYPIESEHLDLKGEYWLGDPCYVFPDDKWQELCKLMFPNGDELFDDKQHVRVVEVEGEKCYMFGTCHGDGCYPVVEDDDVIADLGVDAGMLSIIPMKLVKKKGWGETMHCGEPYEFDGKVRRIEVEDGDLTYGNLRIITSDWVSEFVDYAFKL